MIEVRNYIRGEWVSIRQGREIAIRNPADQDEIVGKGFLASARDAEAYRRFAANSAKRTNVRDAPKHSEATTEPATTEPVSTEPATTGPASTERAQDRWSRLLNRLRIANQAIEIYVFPVKGADGRRPELSHHGDIFRRLSPAVRKIRAQRFRCFAQPADAHTQNHTST